MKIIDENGKLFKKINLIDAIVALLLAIIVIAIGYKAVSASIAAKHERDAANASAAYENSPHLIYQVVCSNTPKEVAEAFEAQMDLPMADRQLMSMGNLLEGYITGCTIVPLDDSGNSYEVTDGDEESEAVDADRYKVYFTIEVVPVEKDGIYSIGTQEVRIGKSHIVKTNIIETSGWVYAMEMEESADA